MTNWLSEVWRELRNRAHRRNTAPTGATLGLILVMTGDDFWWSALGAWGVLIFAAAWAGPPDGGGDG